MTAAVDLAARKLAEMDPHPATIDTTSLTVVGDYIAKRANIRHAQMTQPPAGVDPETGEVLTLNLPAELWNARPELALIRQAAHACGRPADAVFGAVLTRVSALTPPTIQGPAPVGTPCSLNVSVALIGPSGAGKSSGTAVAAKHMPFNLMAEVATINLGSGEGVAEAFMGTVDEVDEHGKTHKVRRQVRRQVLAHLDEGQALSEMTKRQGSTILPVLRSAWSGEALGQQNASDDRTRHIPAHEYRFALLAGFQPETASAIVQDTAGTAQRWLWFRATDPTIPDDFPDWPGSVDWSPPRHQAGPMALAPEVAAEIRVRSLDAARGDLVLAPLDAHRDLSRLKVAALLALMADRLDIDTDDWHLASIILDTSDRVRATILEAARQRADEAERVAIIRQVGRERASATDQENRALTAMVKAMAKTVANHHLTTCSDGCTRRCLSRSTSGKHRALVTIDDAIDDAIDRGYLVAEGDRFRMGESMPS